MYVQVYNIRDNFREANMLPGNDSMEVYEFFSHLQKKRQTAQRRFTPNSVSSPTTSSIFMMTLYPKPVTHSLCLHMRPSELH